MDIRRKLAGQVIKDLASVGAISERFVEKERTRSGEVVASDVVIRIEHPHVEVIRGVNRLDGTRTLQRPRGRNTPVCPDCGPEAPVIERKTVRCVCGQCGQPLTDAVTTDRELPSEFQTLETGPDESTGFQSLETLNTETTQDGGKEESTGFQTLETGEPKCPTVEVMEPPAELIAARQWVARDANKEPIVPRAQKGKTRTPLCGAESDNPETWGTYSEACTFRESWGLAGVGFMFASGFAGVDLDKCRDPETGVIEAWAWQIVRELESYSEVSPSGTGLHIIVRGSLPPGRRVHNLRPGPGRIEMYDQCRYFTVTGQHLVGTPATVEERISELAALHSRIFPPASSPVPRVTGAPSGDDAELIERMLNNPTTGADLAALWRGDLSGVDGDDSRGDWHLCRSLAYWTGGDPERMDRLFRRSGLYRDKWDRPEGTYGTYGRRTISKVLGGA